MAQTTYLQLEITDDDSELFEDWRPKQDGTINSNATKIDAFAGKFAGGVAGQYYKKKSSTQFDGEWETPDSTPTQNSTKLLTSGAAHNAIAAVDSAKKITVATDGAVSQELAPDTFYDFTGALTSLALTLGLEVAGRENEYKGQFTTGATVPTVTLPVGVTWAGGTPTINASKTYQFSILNGIGVMIEV